MTNRHSLCCALILFVFSATAHSQGSVNDLSFYASGHAGLAMLQDATTTDSTLPGTTFDFGFDTDLVFGGAVGARNDQYRGEVEVGYQQNDLDTVSAMGVTVPLTGSGIAGDVSILTALFNAYYDFDLGHAFTPYVTAGVGITQVEAHATIQGVGSYSDTDTVAAFQAGAGIGYAINEQITLDLRYRYLGAADVEFETLTSEVQSHNVLFGVRVDF